MNSIERLHMDLLLYEHPWKTAAERAQHAHIVCRAARRLLREKHGLDGDWPCDKQAQDGGGAEKGKTAGSGLDDLQPVSMPPNRVNPGTRP